MRYTDVDGERYEVKDCGYCPFRDMGDDGWNAHCTHPLIDQDPKARLEIDHDGIAEGCPLRDVPDQHISMDEIIGKMLRVQMGPQEVITYGPETIEAIRLVLKNISEDVENRVEDSMHRAIEENTGPFFGPSKDRTLYMSGVYDIIKILNDELDKLMAKEVEE